jgi:hypothetical protein
MQIEWLLLGLLGVPIGGRTGRRRAVTPFPSTTGGCLRRSIWIGAGWNMLPDDMINGGNLRTRRGVKGIFGIADQVCERYTVPRCVRAFLNGLGFLV